MPPRLADNDCQHREHKEINERHKHEETIGQPDGLCPEPQPVSADTVDDMSAEQKHRYQITVLPAKPCHRIAIYRLSF